ncbi:Protein kinase domain-containing protein [Amycolatopsis pretoriensis]|uniref:Protein kinase domain-containing protein n=1 Tax=Amycolatopsis pretoriensis TaxID=218821 RepID=A0A1H5QF64_9PSEU|nr:AAA domain-containing protein [Amycolatopsis pretoriensis]SEF24750.1 Protein kinase domain-containing protein [Amycolatopsis pretoriensis]
MTTIIAGRYVLVDEPPRTGGLSTVYKAYDVVEQSNVAVKFVSHDDEDLTRVAFTREMEGLRSLRHENIIRLRSAGVDDERGDFYLALDWVDRSLNDVLANGPYSWETLAQDVAGPLSEALAFAHLKEIEHRDIKPKNVLVTTDGVPLLADFGIAKIHREEDSDFTMKAWGSGPYVPPERDGSVRYVRDVYSMGVLLTQALHSARIEGFEDIAPAIQAVNVPPEVRDLLERCTDTDYTRRPVNGAVLRDELKSFLRARPPRPIADRPLIWLKLFGTAEAALRAHAAETGRSPEAIVQDDLKDEVFAEFRFDREKADVDRSVLTIVGTEWRFTLKRHGSLPAFVVTGARILEYEALELIRKHSMNTSSFVTWTCSEPRNHRHAETGRDELLRALDDFNEEKLAAREGRSGSGDEGPDIFDDWNRILLAREDLARGSLEPLRFVGRVMRDREVEFDLGEVVEDDLLGVELEIVHDGARHPAGRGEVVDQRESSITLRSKIDFRLLESKGSLVRYLGPTKVALQRQRDAISAIKDGTAANPDLRDKITNPASVAPPVPRAVENWTRQLDEGKREAVEAALGFSDLLLVQGPPGTGKTDLIAETVFQALQVQPATRILIVSQTHVAVDNALARLEAAGIDGLVRLGHPDDPRVDPEVRHLLLDQKMAKWSEGVRRKAQRYLERRAAAYGVDGRHLHAALALRQLAKVAERQAEIDARIGRLAADDGPSELATSLEVEDDLTTLQEASAELGVRRETLYRDAVRHLGGDLTIGPSIGKDDANAAVDALLGTSAESRQVLGLVELQAEWLQRMSSDQQLAAAFLGTAQVVAGTCLGFVGHAAARTLNFDLCILDEASKATATEALVPLARSKRAILVGDTNQLPPLEEELLRSNRILEEHGIDQKLVRETLFQRLVDRLPDHSKFLLRDQYRMIRPIGDLVSSCFYRDELRSPNDDGLVGYDLLGKPVLWLDTKLLGERRFEDSSGQPDSSFANREEARIVFDRLATLENAARIGALRPPRGQERLEVLLIAPYRRQVEELRRTLARRSFQHLAVTVHSVDAVQGRQCDITIFSVTRSNRQHRMGFLGLDHWRRINVALSRARYGLTIVGDSEFCGAAPGALRDVVRYMREHSATCEIQQVGHV